MTFLRLRALWLTGVLAMAGCAGHPPVALYQLDAGSPRLPKASTGMSVVLGPVAVADYLQHDTLLQRQPDGSLRAATDGRWAGSLSADIDQLLVRQLAWRLDSSRVALAPAPSATAPDVQVQLSITRLDSGDTQPAVLDAQWRVLDRRGVVRDSRIVHLEQKHEGNTPAQVQAQGILLQRLAEQLTVAVRPLANQPPLADEKKVLKAVPKEASDKPKMPLAAPIRTEMEIFRF